MGNGPQRWDSLLKIKTRYVLVVNTNNANTVGYKRKKIIYQSKKIGVGSFKPWSRHVSYWKFKYAIANGCLLEQYKHDRVKRKNYSLIWETKILGFVWSTSHANTIWCKIKQTNFQFNENNIWWWVYSTLPHPLLCINGCEEFPLRKKHRYAIG